MNGFTILDGPVGTALQARGMTAADNPELWTLAHPEALADIQRSYIAAGTAALLAPTFGANPVKLKHNAADVNKQLAALTRRSAGPNVAVGGDLAPLGLFVPPYGHTSFDEIIAAYAVQAQALEQAGVDYFHVETQMSVYETRAAVLAIQDCSQKPIWVSFACDAKGKTLSGADIEAALVTVQAMGVAVFGLNCVTADPVPLFARLRRYAAVPLLYKPNAGLPDAAGVYRITPAQMAAPASDLAALGVTHFGACCGGTAEHIAAWVEALTELKPAAPAPKYTGAVTADHRHAYPDDAPDGDEFSVDCAYDLDMLAEEQFYLTGPVVIDCPAAMRPAVERVYHGVARFE